jgi:hypothetical protein
MHFRRTRNSACGFDDLADTFHQVVVESYVAHLGSRILPTGDVDVEALIDQKLHHALLRIEVEHVELVDPGGNDHDRRRVKLLPGRRVMDHLQQAVAEDNFARGGCQVLADREVRRTRHLDVARLEVGDEIIEALEQAFTVRFHGLLHGRRIRQQEIGRCHGIEPFPPPERGPPTVAIRQAGCVVEHVLHLAGKHQVPLLDDVPCRGIVPDRIGKAGVVRIRRDDILACHAKRPMPGMHLQVPHPG